MPAGSAREARNLAAHRDRIEPHLQRVSNGAAQRADLPDSRRQYWARSGSAMSNDAALRGDRGLNLVHSAAAIRALLTHSRRRTLILSSKSLISLNYFLLKLSSICHDSGLARLARGMGASFCTKLSTTSVSALLQRARFFLQRAEYTIIGRCSAFRSRAETVPCFRSYKPQAGRSGPWLPAPSSRSPSSSSASSASRPPRSRRPSCSTKRWPFRAPRCPTPDVVTQLEQNSALGEVLASGFRALNSDPRCSEVDLRASMENTGRAVAHRLERYLSALATIASAAPVAGPAGHGDRHDRDLRLAGALRRRAPAAIRRSWRTAFRWRCTTPRSA